MIDINVVLDASNSVLVTTSPETQTCRTNFPRQVDSDVLTDLIALKSHGVKITECIKGRVFEFWAPHLNIVALAEQISLCLEQDHKINVQRDWI